MGFPDEIGYTNNLLYIVNSITLINPKLVLVDDNVAYVVKRNTYQREKVVEYMEIVFPNMFM